MLRVITEEMAVDISKMEIHILNGVHKCYEEDAYVGAIYTLVDTARKSIYSYFAMDSQG